MAASWVEIANSALTKIGARSILSLADDSNEARACLLRLDVDKKIVLRMHPWNCAIERDVLASTVDEPAFEYSNEFTLPANSLRVLAITPASVGYRIEGRKILANATELEIKFIKNLTEATDVDELLSEAIACYLAWDICYLITQKHELKESLWQDLQLILRQAKAVDAQEERDYELSADDWDDSRTGGTSPGRANR